jgi:RNA polymerase sigma-70 factor, ECF subfamily
MYRILRNTFLTSRTGLRAAATVSLDSEEEGPELAVENETPETILMRSSNSQLVQSAIDVAIRALDGHATWVWHAINETSPCR